MVQLLAIIERVVLQKRLQSFLGRNIIRGFTAGGLPTLKPFSLREIARRTGWDHRRLSEFVRDPTAIPRTSNARIAALLDDPRLQERSRGKTVAYVDAPRFTLDSVIQMTRPPEATGVRFFGKGLASPGREYGSTTWVPIDEFNDFAASMGDKLDDIERIVFDVG